MSTAALSRRVKRLENDFGASEELRSVLVWVQPGESREQALRRVIQEGGLDRIQVGRVLFFVPGGEEVFEQTDLIPGVGEFAKEREFWDELFRSIRDSGEQRLSNPIALNG